MRLAGAQGALTGLLRFPPSPPPHPAVVLLGGSLPTAKEDERLAAAAAAFVAQGFAVLTTDSRGTGGSEGAFEAASLEQLADDGVAAAAWLRQRPEVRRDAVGFWGVSQGGTWVGPLAAERGGAAFLVAVAGPLTSPEDHVHRFLAGRLREQGLDESAIDRIGAARRVLWSYYATGEGHEAAVAAIAAMKEEPWFPSSGLRPSVTPPDELGALPLQTRVFLAQKGFDPLAAIRRLRCPVLAVYGSEDERLAVADHVEALRALAKGGAGITVSLLPGRDHDLQPVATAPPEPGAEEPFAGMARWAAAQVAGGSGAD